MIVSISKQCKLPSFECVPYLLYCKWSYLLALFNPLQLLIKQIVAHRNSCQLNPSSCKIQNILLSKHSENYSYALNFVSSFYSLSYTIFLTEEKWKNISAINLITTKNV